MESQKPADESKPPRNPDVDWAERDAPDDKPQAYTIKAGGAFRVIVQELLAGGDTDDGPHPIEMEDVLIVENFLCLTRRMLARKLELRGWQGDAEGVAKTKRELAAMDEFLRTVMWNVRIAALAEYRDDEPTASQALESVVDAMLAKLRRPEPSVN